jgi:peroxiredoxin
LAALRLICGLRYGGAENSDKETRTALQVGQQAPDFTMKSNKMKDVKLSELRGSKVLLLFVPLAFTGT